MEIPKELTDTAELQSRSIEAIRHFGQTALAFVRKPIDKAHSIMDEIEASMGSRQIEVQDNKQQ